MRDVPLTLRPNILLETGRTSYGGVIQLFKRASGFMDGDEYIPSLRECIEARLGRVFSSTDYKAGELITHAQSCIWTVGYSDLAAALLKGVDPHGALAATVLGISYDEFIKNKKLKRNKDARQAAKPFNFGKPGGMGSPKIVIQQRKQGPDTPCEHGPSMIKDGDSLVPGYKGLRFCILMGHAKRCGEKKVTVYNNRPIPPTCVACIECAVHLDSHWRKQWRENAPYFQFVQDAVENGQLITGEMLARWPHLKETFRAGQRLAPGEIMQHVSGRIRGGVEFTSATNGYFQALLADAAKSALCRVSRECYDRTCKSPLYGTRVIVFQHDELIAEHPESLAHEGATRISEIMCEELRKYCPDLAGAVEAEPCLMRRWLKSAEKKLDENGRLVPWEPS